MLTTSAEIPRYLTRLPQWTYGDDSSVELARERERSQTQGPAAKMNSGPARASPAYSLQRPLTYRRADQPAAWSLRRRWVVLRVILVAIAGPLQGIEQRLE